MPNKYPQGKGWNVPKQKYNLSNWSEYNKALKQRGRIDTWVSPEAVNNGASKIKQMMELEQQESTPTLRLLFVMRLDRFIDYL